MMMSSSRSEEEFAPETVSSVPEKPPTSVKTGVCVSICEYLDPYVDHSLEPEELQTKRLQGNAAVMEHIKSLDFFARSIIALFFMLWLIYLMNGVPLFLVFGVVVVAPLCFLFHWWKKNQKECTLNHMIRGVGIGFFVVTVVMFFAVYVILMLAWAAISAIDELGGFNDTSVGLIAYTFYVLAFVPFVTAEEMLKAMLVRRLQTTIQEGSESRAHLLNSTAVSCGYAVSQAMAWLTFVHMIKVASDVHYRTNWGVQFQFLLAVGLSFTIFSTPLQLLSGYLIGLELTRDRSKKACTLAVVVPTVLRIIYYCAAIGYLLLFQESVLGFVFFQLTNVGICYLMLKRIKSVEKKMPQEYLRRVGYLTVGGYGVISSVDDADSESVENPVIAHSSDAVESKADLDSPVQGPSISSDWNHQSIIEPSEGSSPVSASVDHSAIVFSQ